jgi:hypothetical protein
MATQARGYGLQLSPNNTDFVTVKEITEIDLPNTVRDISEVTAHGTSDAKTYLGGLVDVGEIVFTTNHNLYNVGEGFGNWNAQLSDGSFSAGSSDATAVWTETDFKSSFIHDEIDINGTGENTTVVNANHGILRNDIGSNAGTGWTTDNASVTNTTAFWNGSVSPRRLTTDLSNADTNPPNIYIEKQRQRTQSPSQVYTLEGLFKYQFDYTLNSFSVQSGGADALYHNYARNGFYSSPYNAIRRHFIPKTIGDHKYAFRGGGYRAFSLYVDRVNLELSNLKLYRLYSFTDCLLQDLNLYGKIIAPDGTTESTFRCCVYNVEKSTAIDGNIENTVTLKLKSELTYV